jgi:hypothetical protein
MIHPDLAWARLGPRSASLSGKQREGRDERGDCLAHPHTLAGQDPPGNKVGPSPGLQRTLKPRQYQMASEVKTSTLHIPRDQMRISSTFTERPAQMPSLTRWYKHDCVPWSFWSRARGYDKQTNMIGYRSANQKRAIF